MYKFHFSTETINAIKTLKKGQRFKDFHVFCDYLHIEYVPNNTNWRKSTIAKLERWVFWKTEGREIIIKFTTPSEMPLPKNNRGKHAKDYIPPVLVEEYYIKK